MLLAFVAKSGKSYSQEMVRRILIMCAIAVALFLKNKMGVTEWEPFILLCMKFTSY